MRIIGFRQERAEPKDGEPDRDGAAPTGDGSGNGSSSPQPGASAGDDFGGPSDPSEDGDPQDEDGPGKDAGSDTPPSHHPCGTGEFMDAAARDDGDGTGEAPVDTAAEEQA